MNSLSWFLYFAGNAKSFSFFFGFLLGLILFIVTFVLYCVYLNEHKKPPFNAKWFLIFPVFWTISVAIPDKDTLYSIAASEMGERVVESELGKKAQAALEAWIDSQLSKPEKETK